MPMCLQADCVAIPIAMERLELTDPVHHTSTHGSPGISVIARGNDVFAMAMRDSIFRKQTVAVRIGLLANSRSIGRIPIQHEASLRYGAQQGCGILPGSRNTRLLIFKHQDLAGFPAAHSRFAQFLIDRAPIRRRIIEMKKVEASDACRFKHPRQLYTMREQLILFLETMVRVEVPRVGRDWVVLPGMFATARFRPIDFKKRARDVGDAKFIFGEDSFGLGQLRRIQIYEILVPHPSQLNPPETHPAGGNLACVAEVLCDFVVNDGEGEGAIRALWQYGGAQAGCADR